MFEATIVDKEIIQKLVRQNKVDTKVPELDLKQWQISVRDDMTLSLSNEMVDAALF